jgi:DNA-binding FadR family transcriptional regulator
MAKTAAQRMASLRARQRQAGLTTLTVVVPQHAAAEFAALAERLRARWSSGPRSTARGLALPRTPATRTSRSAIRARDIMTLRELLEVAAAGLVIARLNAPMERRLRSIVEWEKRLDVDATGAQLQRFHSTMADLSGDQTLRFLLRVALGLTDDHASFRGRSPAERSSGVARIRRAHAAIVDAVLRRDQSLAEARIRRYLAGLEDWLD